MTLDDCPFCVPDIRRVFHAGDLMLGLWDGYPVSPGHALLVPRRHIAGWFDATPAERAALSEGVALARDAIHAKHSPDGINVGINLGAAAGQTIFHLHVHVIPRYAGDVPDPRGGVRHVIPAKGFYDAVDPPSSIVSDEEPTYSRTPVAEAQGAAADATAFGEHILQLLDEGRFTATYKYAVLLALIDLCTEIGPNAEPAIATGRVAEKVLELYWPQTSPYPGERGALVLSQNQGGQAEIVSAIRRFRERTGADPSESLTRAKLRDPVRYERLLSTVEWKLIEMPLPRLQAIGDTQSELLYRIGWDTRVRRVDIEHEDFDRRIHLKPGVVDNLLRFSGLLRPLIQQAWMGMVVRMNRDATDEARLQEFLFGAKRIALDPVRDGLRELQSNRCFYCDGRITGSADVDHFIPWSRHADNGIENLVVADSRCNNHKRDFLAAGEHVERWVSRFDEVPVIGRQLAEVARRADWERHSKRTLNTARTIYTRLPADVRLWLRAREFVPVAAQRTILLKTLRP